MIADTKTIERLLDPKALVLKQEGETYYFSLPSESLPTDEKEDFLDKQSWSTARRLSYEFIKEQLAQAKPGELLLDIGMGQAAFKDLYGETIVVGTDHLAYPDVRVVCDFTKPLPFNDGSFDIILASNVMEHLPNPEEIVREYYRVLKKGGRVIVAVPFMLGVHQAPYDFYRYTEFLLRRITDEAGFSRTDVSILGTGTDTYIQNQTKFFSLILDSKDKEKTFIGKLTVWGLTKLARTLQRVLNFLLSPLFARVGKTMKLPLMYGMVSVK